MISVLRQRNFTLLWTGGLISQTGDWVLFVALPMYVYRLTGSTLATSGTFLAELIPYLVLGPVAGVFVDRWNRRSVIIVSNLALAAGLLPLILARSPGLVWVVYLVAFGQAALSQFLGPAVNAILPTVVPEEDLVTANSLRSLSQNLARLVGPSLGGVVAALGSLTAVTLVDSGTFLAAALMAVFVRGAGQVERAPLLKGVSALRSVWQELLEGLVLIRESRLVATLVVASSIASVGEGVFGVMFIVWVRNILHGGTLQLGWFMSAQAVGGLLGGLVVAHWGKNLILVPVLGAASILFGLLDSALFTYPLFLPGVLIGLALMVIVGLSGAAFGATWNSLLQRGVDDTLRGRIFGVMGATSALAMVIGTLIAGTVGGIVGPIALLNIFQGAGHVLAGMVVLLALRASWTWRKRSLMEVPRSAANG